MAERSSPSTLPFMLLFEYRFWILWFIRDDFDSLVQSSSTNRRMFVAFSERRAKREQEMERSKFRPAWKFFDECHNKGVNTNANKTDRSDTETERIELLNARSE